MRSLLFSLIISLLVGCVGAPPVEQEDQLENPVFFTQEEFAESDNLKGEDGSTSIAPEPEGLVEFPFLVTEADDFPDYCLPILKIPQLLEGVRKTSFDYVFHSDRVGLEVTLRSDSWPVTVVSEFVGGKVTSIEKGEDGFTIRVLHPFSRGKKLEVTYGYVLQPSEAVRNSLKLSTEISRGKSNWSGQARRCPKVFLSRLF
ncbi:hypothetical protein CL634_09260 [bacterium]|nr:hypothetical protein [bacterium]